MNAEAFNDNYLSDQALLNRAKELTPRQPDGSWRKSDLRKTLVGLLKHELDDDAYRTSIAKALLDALADLAPTPNVTPALVAKTALTKFEGARFKPTLRDLERGAAACLEALFDPASDGYMARVEFPGWVKRYPLRHEPGEEPRYRLSEYLTTADVEPPDAD